MTNDFFTLDLRDELSGNDTYSPLSNNFLRFERMKFPSGEQHIKIKTESMSDPYGNLVFENVLIKTRLNHAQDIWELLLATDALRRVCPHFCIAVEIPYIPYARQDRVMVEGEPLSIKVFAAIINAQKYNSVICYDPHSDVTAALIDNLVIRDVSYLFPNAWHNKIWVSPDAGQLKKIYSLAQKFRFMGEICTASKVRDVTNGKILRTELDNTNVKGKDCLILDDICSYGGTFKALAQKLIEAGANSVELFTTHNELVFNAESMKEAGISKVYSTNSMGDCDGEYVEQFKL